MRKVFIIRPPTTILVPNPQGIPVVHTDPGRVGEIKNGEITLNENKKDDLEFIERIRRDSQFGTEDLSEVTKDDEEAMEIRNKKAREADDEIQTKRRTRQPK